MAPDFPQLNRAQGDLVRQLHDALKARIEDGRLRTGETLPTIAEWQRRLGVSDYVPRKAVALLAAEGLVTVRRHVGAVVAAPCGRRWKGRVLVITNSLRTSFAENAYAFALQLRLEMAGYEVVHLPIPWSGGEESDLDFGLLDRHLANDVSLAIVHTVEPKLTAHLDAYGVRYIVESSTGRNFPNAVGRFANDEEADSIRRLTAFWRKAGVRSVLVVDFTRVFSRMVVKALADAGIAIRQLMIQTGDAADRLHAIPQNALEGLDEFLRKNRPRHGLPDAIFFYDDYLAIGGLTALAASGLRVPEDIHVATISNRGFASAWFKPLTRIEHDPVAIGNAVADYVLATLDGKRCRPPRMRSRFIPGQT